MPNRYAQIAGERLLLVELPNGDLVLGTAPGGVSPQLDDTDKLAVSLYGKATAAGDTPMMVSVLGRLQVGGGATLGKEGTGAALVGLTDASDNQSVLAVGLEGWNGATFDSFRNNHEVTALASAARTASVDSADLVNYNCGRMIVVVINVTAVTATPSVVFTIQGKSSLGSNYYTILASGAVTAPGTVILRVGIGLTAAANLTVNDMVPRLFNINATHADADSITYSVSVNFIN